MALRQLIGRLSDLAGDGASYLFLVIVAIASYEVVMRYGFDAPTIWVHELSVALAAVGFLIGGPVVHQRRQHIAITYFLERASPRTRHWAAAAGSLLTLLFLGLLTYAASAQALQALEIMETSGTALNWPIPTVLKSAFAVCSAAMLLQTLAHLHGDILRLHEGAE
jgi:TRAP-type C4-dicarboxylate transport system permease small subunit